MSAAGVDPDVFVHVRVLVGVVVSLGLAQLPVWHFGTYAFVVCYAILFFVICALLFPDNVAEYDGFKGYFYARRAWFFGLLGLSYLVDIADTALKGVDRFVALGLEYPIRATVVVLLCALAVVVRNERFHAAFAIGNLGYEMSWAARIFDSVH